jgi:hypothetical protein
MEENFRINNRFKTIEIKTKKELKLVNGLM